MDLIHFSADLLGVTRKSFGEQFRRVIVELQVETIPFGNHAPNRFRNGTLLWTTARNIEICVLLDSPAELNLG